jgi:hypothetical protein
MNAAQAHALLDFAKLHGTTDPNRITAALRLTGDIPQTKGIRTIDDIKTRCWVDDDTGCWHWRGAMSGRGKYPAMWLADPQKRVTMPTAVCYVLTGEMPAKGVVWHSNCGNVACGNPEHRCEGTDSSKMLAAKITRSPLVRARMSAGRSKNSTLTLDALAEIRASSDILRVIAQRHGISIAWASRIRLNQVRLPRAAAGNSVFNQVGGKS